MTDAVASYLVVYRVKKTGKYRTRVYQRDGDLHALANTTQITIISVKVVNPAEPGEGLSWLARVKHYFRSRDVGR
jgi:hypothetical protein